MKIEDLYREHKNYLLAEKVHKKSRPTRFYFNMHRIIPIDKPALREFRRLYANEFGEKLDDATARRKAENFLAVMDAVVRSKL